MSDWTWAEWTIAILAFGGIAYALHRARAIGEQARRREWAERTRMRNRERGEP